MKKVLSILLVVVMSVAVLAGCSSKPAEAPAAAPAETPAATPAPAETPATTPAPAATTGLKDGSYKAAQDKFDDHGWKAQIAIDVKDGKITTVDFDYVNQDNKLKSEDQNYIKAMEDQTKINIAKAIEELEGSLVSGQDVSAVNAVSGATSTSNDFKAMAEAALKDAK